MSNEQEAEKILLQKIRDKRKRIAAFISDVEPRGVRFTNLSIIFGAIATALTAGPAIAGKNLTDALGSIGSRIPSWQILCALASISSLIAAIATNLYKSHEIASNLSKARTCDAKLEGIQALVELGKLPLDDAALKYEACLSDIAFIPPDEERPGRRPSLEAVRGSISAPAANAIVGRKFLCSGQVQGHRGLSLWLAVEINGGLWPKESPVYVESDGSWSKNVFEDGASGDFALALYAADAKSSKYIRAWLNNCDQMGVYPELKRTPGMVRIDSVTVRLVQEQPKANK